MVIKNVYMFINTHFYFRIVKEKINLIESRPLLQVSRPKGNAKRKTPTTWALHGITVSSNSDNTVQHVSLNKIPVYQLCSKIVLYVKQDFVMFYEYIDNKKRVDSLDDTRVYLMVVRVY